MKDCFSYKGTLFWLEILLIYRLGNLYWKQWVALVFFIVYFW